MIKSNRRTLDREERQEEMDRVIIKEVMNKDKDERDSHKEAKNKSVKYKKNKKRIKL